MSEQANGKQSFEEQIARLEQIKAEEALALFEEGTRLAASCSAMLDEAEQRVVKLRESPDGPPEELPFEEEAGQ